MGTVFLRIMRVDFTDPRLLYRLQHLQGTNELIAKAVGLKKTGPCRVFDTTAGLGKEAFLLAALGCEVTLFERHPTISALLNQGLIEAKQHADLAPIITRMQLIPMCAITYLQNNPSVSPEVIYCDPMFAHRTKSALVKKEMQYLQEVVGPDEDANELIAICFERAQHRVVVKRPRLSPFLIRKPDVIYQGRSHRFDVYIMRPATCSKPASCKI